MKKPKGKLSLTLGHYLTDAIADWYGARGQDVHIMEAVRALGQAAGVAVVVSASSPEERDEMAAAASIVLGGAVGLEVLRARADDVPPPAKHQH